MPEKSRRKSSRRRRPDPIASAGFRRLATAFSCANRIQKEPNPKRSRSSTRMLVGRRIAGGPMRVPRRTRFAAGGPGRAGLPRSRAASSSLGARGGGRGCGCDAVRAGAVATRGRPRACATHGRPAAAAAAASWRHAAPRWSEVSNPRPPGSKFASESQFRSRMTRSGEGGCDGWRPP